MTDYNDMTKGVGISENVDRDILVSLYYEYHAALYSFAMYYLKNEEDAKDILQDVFVKLWASSGALKGISNTRSYLFSMVKHHVLNYMRNRNLSLQHNYKLLQQQESVDENLMRFAEKSDNAERLQQAIVQLPRQQKKIVKLRFEGYSNREIANVLNLSINTVNSHWRACQKNLHKILELGIQMILIIMGSIHIS